MMGFFIAALACAETENSGCDTGFVKGADGQCYQAPGEPSPPPPTADVEVVQRPGADDNHLRLSDLLLDCIPGSDDNGRLDVEKRCADGICIGMSYDDVVALHGTPTTCDEDAAQICTWIDGMEATLTDGVVSSSRSASPTMAVLRPGSAWEHTCRALSMRGVSLTIRSLHRRAMPTAFRLSITTHGLSRAWTRPGPTWRPWRSGSTDGRFSSS